MKPIEIDSKMKPTLKYKNKILIADHQIGLKPFLHNTFGNIVYAILVELKDIPAEGEVTMQIDPTATEEQRLVLKIGGKDFELHAFVQDMMHKTIAGWLSSLKDVVPEGTNIFKTPLSISLQRK